MRRYFFYIAPLLTRALGSDDSIHSDQQSASVPLSSDNGSRRRHPFPVSAPDLLDIPSPPKKPSSVHCSKRDRHRHHHFHATDSIAHQYGGLSRCFRRIWLIKPFMDFVFFPFRIYRKGNIKNRRIKESGWRNSSMDTVIDASIRMGYLRCSFLLQLRMVRPFRVDTAILPSSVEH